MNFELNMLCEFASKDKNRPLINTISFDESGVVVATDGYRLFASKAPFKTEMLGKIFDASTLAATGEFKEVKESYIAWKEMFKDIDFSSYKTCFLINIPTWFNTFKHADEKVLFTIDFTEIDRPKIISGNFQNDFSIGIDGRFLSSFSGMNIFVHVDRYTSPIFITPNLISIEKENECLKTLKEQSWFSIIMPIKLDPSEVIRNKNNILI